MLSLSIHRDPTIFLARHAEWNTLLARSICRVPFLRAEYLHTWWRHMGGGEWAGGELVVVLAQNEAGDLVGIAPLFAAPNRDGRSALLLVGSIEISDYLDVIVARDHLDEFCAALLERLTASDVPAWEVLDLNNLPEASPSRAALARAAQQRGWAAAASQLQAVPVIKLPDTWDKYLDLMDKKESKELKRKMRRAMGGEFKTTWRISQPNQIEEDAPRFMAMMTLNEDKARFLTPAMRGQFAESLKTAAEHGWLHLAFLEIEGEPAAAYLSFDFGNRLYVYNSAIDPKYNSLSAGWVLLGHLIQWCIENKRTEFDFMRGDEDYKFRFGGSASRVCRLQVSSQLTVEQLGGESASGQNPLEAEYFPA